MALFVEDLLTDPPTPLPNLISAHIADTVDAHDASAIEVDPTTPVGLLTDTDVQAALESVNGKQEGVTNGETDRGSFAKSFITPMLPTTNVEQKYLLFPLDLTPGHWRGHFRVNLFNTAADLSVSIDKSQSGSQDDVNDDGQWFNNVGGYFDPDPDAGHPTYGWRDFSLTLNLFFVSGPGSLRLRWNWFSAETSNAQFIFNLHKVSA